MAKWDMVEVSCTDLFPSQEQTFLVVPTMPDLDSDPVYPTKEGGARSAQMFRPQEEGTI